MTPELAARISTLRLVLANSPDADDAGLIGPPYAGTTLPQRIPPIYQDFLRVANGAACGAVELFDASTILAHQREVGVARSHRFFCFGRVEGDVFLLDVTDGTVSQIAPNEKVRPEEALGEFDYFLLNHVFGQGYAELVQDAEDDAWFRLLRTTSSLDVE
jgi:hypothetical protein